MNILCLLGFHNWKYTMKYFPSFNAIFIERVVEKKKCLRCQIKETTIDSEFRKTGEIFDKLTGELI